MSSSIQFVRNATFVLHYAGTSILVDPLFAEKGRYPGFPGTVNSELSNPLVDMPINPESLLDGIDAVVVSHLHPDHWDEVAVQLIPKDLKIYAQNEEDAEIIRSQGFTHVVAMKEENDINRIKLQKTYCQHGTDAAYSIPELAAILGKASGCYFTTSGEKSVYYIGDTIWIEEVESNLKKWKPDVVLVNAGKATLLDDRLGAIIMGKEDLLKIHRILPETTIVAIHLETVNHCILSRRELRQFTEEQGFSDKVRIPEDGEQFSLES